MTRNLVRALLFAIMVMLLSGRTPLHAQTNSDLWISMDAGGQPTVNLYYFWTPTCPYCREARPFVDSLDQDYPWIQVRSYDLTAGQENAMVYQRMAAATGNQAQYVPAFIFCEEMVVGYNGVETTGAQILEVLEACYDEAVAALPPGASTLAPQIEGADTVSPDDASTAPSHEAGSAPVVDEPAQPQEPDSLGEDQAPAAAAQIQPAPLAPMLADTSFNVPFVGLVQAQSLSLPLLTLVLAGLDAFNPCAFFVLLFLLSMVIHARSRMRMAVIGGVFVFFSGALYFVFMAAWLNVFLWLGELLIITFIAGLLALVFGALNIKDYFFFKQGPSLSIPDQAKPALFDRMRGLIRVGSWPALIGSTVLLAIVANSYELLCTAGFPMVFTRVLTLNDLSTPTYYGYLLAYSLIYVVPLAAIVAVFTIRFSARKLSEDEGRILKLLSGLMMFFMGVVLVLAPEWMSRVEVAVGLLAAAVVITLLLRWFAPASPAAGKPEGMPEGKNEDSKPQAPRPASKSKSTRAKSGRMKAARGR